MIESTATIIIHAPAREVFAVAADPYQQLIWDAGNFTDLQSLDNLPLGKGSKFSCRVKGVGKMTYEFSDYQPFKQFVHQSKTWMNSGVHTFDFTEKDGATRLTQIMQIKLQGIGVLLYPFAKRILGRQLVRLNNELKNYVERKATEKS